MKKQTTIYEQLIAAEQAEEKAKSHRIELEEELFGILKSQLKKTEGQETISDSGYSITIRQPWSHKINDEKYRALCETLPEELQVHKVSLSIDKKKYDIAVAIGDKKYIRQIQDCIISTPNKISVKVEKI